MPERLSGHDVLPDYYLWPWLAYADNVIHAVAIVADQPLNQVFGRVINLAGVAPGNPQLSQSVLVLALEQFFPRDGAYFRKCRDDRVTRQA